MGGVARSLTLTASHLLLKLHLCAWYAQVSERSLALALVVQCAASEDAARSGRAFCCWRLSVEAAQRQAPMHAAVEDLRQQQFVAPNDTTAPRPWAEGLWLRNRDDQSSGTATPPPQLRVRFSDPPSASAIGGPASTKTGLEPAQADLTRSALAEPVAETNSWHLTPNASLDSPGVGSGGRVVVQCGRARMPMG